jgi:hypothetical protein
MNSDLTADELSAQTLENKKCRPILTHVFNVEVQTQLSREDAKRFLFGQINAGRQCSSYYEIQEKWPTFGGAKITIK